jgi:hypothetical protein
LTAPDAVVEVDPTAFAAVDPVLLTALPALGLTPETPEATELAVLLTPEATVWPALERTFETVPAAL